MSKVALWLISVECELFTFVVEDIALVTLKLLNYFRDGVKMKNIFHRMNVGITLAKIHRMNVGITLAKIRSEANLRGRAVFVLK